MGKFGFEPPLEFWLISFLLILGRYCVESGGTEIFWYGYGSGQKKVSKLSRS